MSTPSLLGDLGHQVACLPASTATDAFINIAAGTDTGTVTNTGAILDLARALGKSNTGGKPLDKTVNPLGRQRRQYKSIGIAIPLEMVFHSSGKYIIVSVAHSHRLSTSGAGSTFATIQTDVKKFKMGTDTDATIFHGFVSAINAQAVKRYYKATVTVYRRKATSTAAKDTSTDTSVLINAPVYLFGGAGSMPAQE